MFFSSIPAYLDPSNWQQQQPNNQIGSSGGSINSSPLAAPPVPPLPPSQLQAQPPSVPAHGGSGSSSGSFRPGSIADRARMANIPMPEAALTCPRCESTNTKFCYFNNYSLTQPRHFCKTCKRYWTRGGALRNVPVGGGFRRNKRNKAITSSSSSKSPFSSCDNNSQNPSGSSTTVSPNSGISSASLLGLNAHIPPLRFMSPLSHNHHLTTDYGIGDISLNYGEISAPVAGGGVTSEMNFQMGSNFLGSGGFGGGGVASLLSAGGIEQWRLQQAQQFPFLGGLDSSSPVGTLNYPLHHQTSLEPSGYAGETNQARPPKLSASMRSQLASVKIEDNQDSRLPFMGVTGSTEQWSASSWTDLSSFSSCSTSNPL